MEKGSGEAIAAIADRISYAKVADRSAAIMVAAGTALVVLSLAAELLRLGARNGSFGPLQLSGVFVGLAAIFGSYALKKRDVADRNVKSTWLLPRLFVMVLAAGVIAMAGVEPPAPDCPSSARSVQGGELLYARIRGDRTICTYEHIPVLQP